MEKSNQLDRPVISLPLDEIVSGQNIMVQSDSNVTGRVYGNPQVLPDDLFGSCLSFNGSGDYGELSGQIALSEQATWAAWVKPGPENSGVIFENRQIYLYWSGNSSKFYINFQKDNVWVYQPKYTQNSYTPGTWLHVAVVWDGDTGKMQVYVNGKLDLDSTIGKGKLTTDGQKNLFVAARYSKNRFFKGSLAHICIYDHVLSARGIEALMEQNKTAQAAFKTEYPLNFSFYDQNEKNVFYITEQSGLNHINLEIENVSHQNIKISSTGNAVPGKDNYHFELMFKPHTFEKELSAADNSHNQYFIKGDGENKDWVIGSGEKQADGKVSLYLLYTGNKELIVKKYSSLLIGLLYQSADKGAGSRSSLVELLYQHLAYECQAEPLKGTRVQSIEIINQRGKKNIPLYFNVIGSNSILNDAATDQAASGSASQLRLRLVNTLVPDLNQPEKNRISFKLGDMDEEKNTKFSLFFGDPVGESWDFASVDQLNAIEVQAKMGGKSCRVIKKNQGQGPLFEITPAAAYLGPGDHIDLDLINIHSNKSSGLASIFLKYEDIPGYWEGRFAVEVEKSPLVHRDESGHKNVGIGCMPESQSRLKVSGDTKLSGRVGIGTNPDSNSRLTVSGDTKLSGRVGIATNPDSKAGLNVNGSIKAQKAVTADQFNDGENTGYYVKPSHTSSLNIAHINSGHGIVPIGTVIDWWRATASTPIPEGWHIADGYRFTQADVNNGQCHASLKNMTLPNLTNKFVRGVTHKNHYGVSSGGSDSHNHSNNFRTSRAGKHNHNWLWYMNKAVYSYDRYGNRFRVFNWGDGHDSEGSGFYSFTWSTFYDFYTDNESSHYHKVDGDTGWKSNIPCYVGLLKLVRVL